ncbi:MAG: hypothetical protein HUU02_02065 [Bacteroidetes bacterium]|nr:hypothetical protein [Bacteroidota bacterium]
MANSKQGHRRARENAKTVPAAWRGLHGGIPPWIILEAEADNADVRRISQRGNKKSNFQITNDKLQMRASMRRKSNYQIARLQDCAFARVDARKSNEQWTIDNLIAEG